MVSGLVWSIGSGSAAIATRLTAAAATAVVSAPAPVRKFLRFVISIPLLSLCRPSVTGCFATTTGRGRGHHRGGRLAGHGGCQCGVGEPELLVGVDGCDDTRYLLAGVGQQFEHADQHAVVAQHVFFG